MSEYKPITGELRKYATVSWDPWPEARDRLYQMCDRIDAIHAGLERENEALRERLEKMDNRGDSMHIGEVTVAVTPRIDWMRMVDELDVFTQLVRGFAEQVGEDE